MAVDQDSCTLFMTGWAPTVNTYTTLQTFGASVPGAEFIQEVIPLFAGGTPFFNTRTLYVEGHDPLGPFRNESITLFMEGANLSVGANIPLYTTAPEGVNEWLRLSIIGTGEYPGSLPMGEGIPLFINRVNNVHTAPLFCKAAEGESNSYIPLYMEGVIPTVDSIPLVAEGAIPINSYVTLVCWNDPVPMNTFIPLLVLGVDGVETDFITLVVPATHGDDLGSVILYTDGH